MRVGQFPRQQRIYSSKWLYMIQIQELYRARQCLTYTLKRKTVLPCPKPIPNPFIQIGQIDISWIWCTCCSKIRQNWKYSTCIEREESNSNIIYVNDYFLCDCHNLDIPHITIPNKRTVWISRGLHYISIKHTFWPACYGQFQNDSAIRHKIGSNWRVQQSDVSKIRP